MSGPKNMTPGKYGRSLATPPSPRPVLVDDHGCLDGDLTGPGLDVQISQVLAKLGAQKISWDMAWSDKSCPSQVESMSFGTLGPLLNHMQFLIEVLRV